MSESWNILKRLEQALQGKEEKPAKGFLTTVEWAEAWGKSISHTSKMLRSYVRNGLMVMKPYRRNAGSRFLWVPHYAEKIK